MFKSYSMELGGRTLTLEFGKYAEQASGSTLVRYGDTVVLVNATVADTPRPGIDFFPLGVDYEEKLYSVGHIPGSWNRREGRPGGRFPARRENDRFDRTRRDGRFDKRDRFERRSENTDDRRDFKKREFENPEAPRPRKGREAMNGAAPAYTGKWKGPRDQRNFDDKPFEKPHRAKRFDNRPTGKGSGEVRRRENKPKKEN